MAKKKSKKKMSSFKKAMCVLGGGAVLYGTYRYGKDGSLDPLFNDVKNLVTSKSNNSCCESVNPQPIEASNQEASKVNNGWQQQSFKKSNN